MTLQRTLRARQHWQALDALRLTGLVAGVLVLSNPAIEAVRLFVWGAIPFSFVPFIVESWVVVFNSSAVAMVKFRDLGQSD